MDYSINQSSWGRAKQDTIRAQKTAKFVWVGQGVLAAAGVSWLTKIAPLGASTLEVVAQAVIGGLGGLIIAIIAVFSWNLFRAPYKQRDEARMLLQTRPKPIPLYNRNELRGAIATLEDATIQLVNQQNIIDAANIKSPYTVDTTEDIFANRDQAYAAWNQAMNELRRQYLIAGDPYESICVDLTGFIATQIAIKMGTIQPPPGEKPVITSDALRFLGILGGRVKETLTKIEAISEQAPNKEDSQKQ